MLTGLFNDKESSESAYKSLRDRGYSDDEINVVMSEDTRKNNYANDDTSDLGSKAAEGTGVGGLIGGTIGGGHRRYRGCRHKSSSAGRWPYRLGSARGCPGRCRCRWSGRRHRWSTCRMGYT